MFASSHRVDALCASNATGLLDRLLLELDGHGDGKIVRSSVRSVCDWISANGANGTVVATVGRAGNTELPMFTMRSRGIRDSFSGTGVGRFQEQRRKKKGND